VLHCDEIDTTTLSPECQQPCQPSPSRVAGTIESVALQRFSHHSRVFERNPVDPRSWAVPARCQGSANSKHGFANSVPRVGCDDHTEKTGDVEVKGRSSTLRTTTDRPGRDRTAFPWPAAPNPLTRVSTTLSRECQQPCQEPCQKPSNCRSGTTSENSRMPPRRLPAKAENTENGNGITLW
jgi:hypothetical protein